MSHASIVVMTNPFPILFLSLFAHMILRIFVGSILIFLGVRHATEYRKLPSKAWFSLLLASIEILAGSLFILGAFTQYAALLIILLSGILMIVNKRLPIKTMPSRIFYLLLLGVAFSLFITGAGAIAFDLPI